MSIVSIEKILVTKFPANLVKELLDYYQEQKRKFFLGNHRPTEVEGGRFSEAAFRMLESVASIPVTPIGKMLGTDMLIEKLRLLPATFGDSIRFDYIYHALCELCMISGIRETPLI